MHRGTFAAYRGSAGGLCIQLATEGTISCDFVPRPGQAVHLAYANWLWLNAGGNAFGVFVVGAIAPGVASVRVSLGAGRWLDATILTLPSGLEFPFRLFYMQERTGFQSLARSLPIVALDAQGREIGRIHYLIQGG